MPSPGGKGWCANTARAFPREHPSEGALGAPWVAPAVCGCQQCLTLLPALATSSCLYLLLGSALGFPSWRFPSMESILPKLFWPAGVEHLRLLQGQSCWLWGGTKGWAAPRCPQRARKGIQLENAERAWPRPVGNGVKGRGLGSALVGHESISCLSISQAVLHWCHWAEGELIWIIGSFRRRSTGAFWSAPTSEEAADEALGAVCRVDLWHFLCKPNENFPRCAHTCTCASYSSISHQRKALTEGRSVIFYLCFPVIPPLNSVFKKSGNACKFMVFFFSSPSFFHQNRRKSGKELSFSYLF